MSATSEKAYEAIKFMLRTGDIPPGARLIELELVEKLGISRTPIREALKKLVEERWLEYLPNRGMRVRVWTNKDVQDNFFVRTILECEAVALCAEHIPARAIEELRMMNKQLRAIASHPSQEAIEQMTRINLDFHQCIWAHAGNRALEDVLLLNINMPTMVRTYQHYDAEKTAASLEEHDAMIAAFEARDPEKARHLMQQHLNRANAIFNV
ncbi:MAG: GntR family transcriptional regulator [Nitritalea sp.]